MRRSVTPFILTAIQSPAGGVSWRDQAECRTIDPGIFFPDPGDVLGVERAKQVCDGCPVASECLSYAVGTNQTEGSGVAPPRASGAGSGSGGLRT